MKTAEELIIEAAASEQEGQIPGALHTLQRGFLEYPDNYEIAFMIANDHLMLGDREEAYLYYLLAISLCKDEPEDLVVITEAASAADLHGLDAVRTKELLRSLIDERLKLRVYQSTYRFVSMLVFSDDPFLFQEVNDSWLRYYHILLEITDCERNRGLQMTTADRIRDPDRFREASTEMKFAVRRLWFQIEPRDLLLSVVRKWELSPEFVVVLTKCSVTKEYTSAVLEKAADLLEEAGRTEDAGVVRRYAMWSRGQGESMELPETKRMERAEEAAFSFTELDASDQDPSAVQGSFDPEKTVAWIFCATKRIYVDEIILYLKNQDLPSGFRGIACAVWNSPSMTAGYNYAMKTIPAKYKIYIHQDTFLFDPGYTAELIRTLKGSGWSLLGLAGSEYMPQTGRWWDTGQEAIHMCLLQDMVMYILNSVTEKETQGVLPMHNLDGVLLATKEDVPWRSDLFTDFHFYDVSACREYRKRGLAVGMLQSGKAGVLHEVSVTRGSRAEIRYEEEKLKFLKEYPPGRV